MTNQSKTHGLSSSDDLIQVIVTETYKIKLSKEDYEAVKRGEEEIYYCYDENDLIDIEHWRWDID